MGVGIFWWGASSTDPVLAIPRLVTRREVSVVMETSASSSVG